MRNVKSLLTFGLVMMASVSSFAWNVSTDFSTANNPNGPWTFGYLTGPADAVVVNSYTVQNSSSADGGTVYGWMGDGWNALGHCSITQNAAIDEWNAYYEIGQVTMGVPYTGSWGCLAWTAPQAGIYALSSCFSGQNTDSDGTTSIVRVAKNLVDGSTTWLSDNGVAGVSINGFVGRGPDFTDGYGSLRAYSYNNTLQLQAGDSILFVTQSGSPFSGDHWNNDAVGLTATINPVPEPSGLLSLLAGAVSLASFRLRRRQH